MDGTFYLGRRLLPGALDFIHLLESRRTPYLFLTNNSSRSRKEYAEKIRRFGLDLPEERIFTSGEATALYLQKTLPGGRIYVVGTPALEQEFISHGFTLSDENPQAAVLGFDTTLTYAKLDRLCQLAVAGIPYIATHPDINCPTETGYMPDIGAMMALVAASTGRQPDVVVGKPNSPIVEALSEKTHLPVDQLCMVGDRLYTDIAMGNTGLLTALVLSGETHLEDIPNSPHQPDLVAEHLGELAQYLAQP